VLLPALLLEVVLFPLLLPKLLLLAPLLIPLLIPLLLPSPFKPVCCSKEEFVSGLRLPCDPGETVDWFDFGASRGALFGFSVGRAVGEFVRVAERE
jgi:hypothetical protein